LSLDVYDDNGHVGFARFGLDKLSTDGQLDALLRELPAVRPTAAEIITRACYQTEYGIFNHEQLGSQRPLALVAVHPKEETMEGSPLYKHIRRFYNYQIHAKFGLSLTEFLEMPPHLVELLYDIAGADATQQEQVGRAVQRQMNADMPE